MQLPLENVGGRSVHHFAEHWPLSVDCHGNSDTFIQIFNKISLLHLLQLFMAGTVVT